MVAQDVRVSHLPLGPWDLSLGAQFATELGGTRGCAGCVGDRCVTVCMSVSRV